ncbi:single-stranded DNA-binding protein [Kitasatospora sp. NPDC096147]|uniref:single-stranded DNA-binding protein n=1 Tax=Kitasatospora sp. NPDC096147 TaxID=3364093 RepID=UPI0038182BD0
MNESMVTMIGNVATVVNYSQTAAGVPVANFRMAATERRYDREKGDWVEGDVSWVTVKAWRWLAANVVSSLSKGDPVVVSGCLRVREWGEPERRRCVVEIDARVVGHDLGRGTTAFRWAVRAKPELVGGRPDREPAEVGRVVPEWIVAAVSAGGPEGPDGAVERAPVAIGASVTEGEGVAGGVRELDQGGEGNAAVDRVVAG